MTFSFEPKRSVARRVGSQVVTVALSVGLTLATLRVFPTLMPARSPSPESATSTVQVRDEAV